MKKKLRRVYIGIMGGIGLFPIQPLFAENKPDPLIHQIGIEGRSGYIFPTNPFFRGENDLQKPLKKTLSAQLKYSFQFQNNTPIDKIYGGAYQGLGIGYFNFGNTTELGNPLAVYLFQGGRIRKFTPGLSLNYEWNFGVSSGWKPYNYETNFNNVAIGSKMNAYMNVNFYLKWILSRRVDFISGVTLNHFSNGNTQFPNAGLNSIGLKIGLVYNINRLEQDYIPQLYRPLIPAFPRHFSYDLVLFGSWRRKGVIFMDKQIASPHSYEVAGINFSALYNFGYKLRAGLSLDGVYDASANVYTEDYIVGTEQQFFKPPLSKQFALGLSARGEYVMPFFTVGIGLGYNILQGGPDLKGFYQMLALKIEITRSSFLHIGYNLQNFHTPNYLMLGIGFRFHNRSPFCYR